MREYLFRGKATNRDPNHIYRTNYKNGDWVYGLLSDCENYRGFAVMTNTDGISDIDVDRNTIGQYTGLTDKAGNKIFEGDIVNVNTNKDTLCHRYEGRNLVIRFDEYHRFVASGRLEYPLCDHYEWEVIGNIHSNPELLEASHE